MHAPDGGSSRDVEHLRDPLFQQEPGCGHATIAALANQQDFPVPWDLRQSRAEYAQRNILRAFGVAARKLPWLAHIYEYRFR